MIRDFDDVKGEELPAYDLCVIGSGPAGATLVAELAASGLRIAVIERGLQRASERANTHRHVISDGIVIREDSREFVLGGASTTWSGISAPLDRSDLEARDQRSFSGWPIPYDELLWWYQRASERYRFPSPKEFEANSPGGFAAHRSRGDLVPKWTRLEEKVFLTENPAPDFGSDWSEIWEMRGVDLWLNATALELQGETDSSRVETVLVGSPSGRRFPVRSNVFVLATGGIENARILLLSRNRWPNGLGNKRDQVGRYMMNHPKGNRGVVRFSRASASPYFFGSFHNGRMGYAGIRLRDEEQRRLGLTNCYLRLQPLFPWSNNSGVEAFLTLARRARRRLRSSKLPRMAETERPDGFAAEGDSERPEADLESDSTIRLFFRSILGAPRILQYLYSVKRQGGPSIRRACVRNFMEMEPDPENRVLLSEEVDSDGRSVPLVRHRVTERDRRSLIELHRAFAEELEQNGIGRLGQSIQALEPWPIDLDASHHMGTTRMGTDPARSVVNSDLRLHEAANVFLAGASVFPSGGCANPTYTIVALSIRLANHLATNVFSRQF